MSFLRKKSSACFPGTAGKLRGGRAGAALPARPRWVLKVLPGPEKLFLGGDFCNFTCRHKARLARTSLECLQRDKAGESGNVDPDKAGHAEAMGYGVVASLTPQTHGVSSEGPPKVTPAAVATPNSNPWKFVWDCWSWVGIPELSTRGGLG